MAAKKKNFAQAVQRLETIISTMEKVDTPLEEALKLYKEGMALSIQCSEDLRTAEKEVTLLQQSASGVFEEVLFDWEE